MKDAATMLSGGSSTSSFDPPSGWRWRRELCLTERSQQCQSGPRPGSTIDAIEWTVTPAGEATSGRVFAALPEMQGELHGKGGACGWHRRGACGLHRQNLADLGTDLNEIHVDVDSVGENLEENRALPRDTRAAPPGGMQAAPSGREWSATLKLDRPIVRVLSVNNDGGVSRYQA